MRGVSVITAGIEATGHGIHIDDKSLQTALAVASKFPQGIKAKMEHSYGVDKIIGHLKNFRIDGAQLRADLQLLKAHPAYNFIAELIAKQPSTFGLSISFSFTGEVIEGKKMVRFEDIYSIDVVDRPAANPGGMFSTVKPTPPLFGLARVEAAFRAQVEKATKPRVTPGTITGFGLARVRAAFEAQTAQRKLMEKRNP